MGFSSKYIYYENAYDKVKWYFLSTSHVDGRFCTRVVCEWIEQFFQRGSVEIRVNDYIGRYFQTMKGLRQGALSLMISNIVVDMLVILIARAKEDG